MEAKSFDYQKSLFPRGSRRLLSTIDESALVEWPRDEGHKEELTRDQQEWMDLLDKVTEDEQPDSGDKSFGYVLDGDISNSDDFGPYRGGTFDDRTPLDEREPSTAVQSKSSNHKRPTFDESIFETDHGQPYLVKPVDVEVPETRHKQKDRKTFDDREILLDDKEYEDDIVNGGSDEEMDLLAEIVEKEIDEEIEHEITEEIVDAMNQTEDGKRFLKFFKEHKIAISSVLAEPTKYQELIKEFSDEERIKRKAQDYPPLPFANKTGHPEQKPLKLHLLSHIDEEHYFNDSVAR